MRQIRDIVCLSTVYGEMYQEDGLVGSILLDNNKIEGIVIDPDYEETYFIFGNIEGRKIKIILSSDDDKELPKMYLARKDKNKFYGDKYVKNRFVELPIEECQISILDPEDYRNVEADELLKLERKVSAKRESLGLESRILYDEIMGTKRIINAKQV